MVELSQESVSLLIQKIQSGETLTEREQDLNDQAIAQGLSSLIAFRGQETSDPLILIYKSEAYVILCESDEPQNPSEDGTDHISICDAGAFGDDSPELFQFTAQAGRPYNIEISVSDDPYRLDFLQAYPTTPPDRESQTPMQIVQNDLASLHHLAPLGSRAFAVADAVLNGDDFASGQHYSVRRYEEGSMKISSRHSLDFPTVATLSAAGEIVCEPTFDRVHQAAFDQMYAQLQSQLSEPIQAIPSTSDQGR